MFLATAWLATPVHAQWDTERWDSGRGHYVEGTWVSQGQQEQNDANEEALEAPQWQPGKIWPEENRAKRFLVSELDAPHLRNPPTGHLWYRVDNDFVLVRTRDNLIVDILYPLPQ